MKAEGAESQFRPPIKSAPKLEGTWGLSGVPILLNLFRASSNTNNPIDAANPLGVEGKYKITILLNRPGNELQSQAQISFADDLSGDSHLIIGRDEKDFIEFNSKKLDGEHTCIGYANDKGFLGNQ